MPNETIDDILKRRAAEKPVNPPGSEKDENKFFSILVGDGECENFLEIKNRNGLCTCFPYDDVIWMVYDPDFGISLDIGGYAIGIKGRGLAPKLFTGLKQKRVAWVKEADHELQDNKANEIFISEITIEPPTGFAEEEESGQPEAVTEQEASKTTAS